METSRLWNADDSFFGRRHLQRSKKLRQLLSLNNNNKDNAIGVATITSTTNEDDDEDEDEDENDDENDDENEDDTEDDQ